MPDDKHIPEVPETRSLATDVGAIAAPVAVVAAPLVHAWATSHFNQGGNGNQHQNPPSPQPQQQRDE
jgi:hypothetical protein